MERRTFLKIATHSLGALFGAVLGLPALAYLIDARNRPTPKSDFKPVGHLSDLEVGVPRQATIKDVTHDAWTLYPNEVIGRVWMVRRPDDKVDVFTTTCPHLGCSINFQERDRLFVCPCHNGTFDLHGDLYREGGRQNPAPRGMDPLPVQLADDPGRMVDDPDNPGQKKPDKLIQVKFQKFVANEEARIVVS
jgi:Rieske Fe-S protein